MTVIFFYLPLGTNLTRNTAVEMNAVDRLRFACDISFIGNLYSVTKNALDELKEKFGNNTTMDDDTLFATALIVKAIAHKERKEMLERLTGFDLSFYTNDKDVVIKGVSSKGALDYIEELPKAYCFSKINLNITMRGITSGIPLRVFDMMGMGEFTLTNYQPEVDELFSPGKDIEVYHDFREMEALCGKNKLL